MANSDIKNSLENFLGINSSNITKEIAKIQKELVELSTSFEKNKQEINSTSKVISDLCKKQEYLEGKTGKSGKATKKQKEQMQSLKDKISEATANLGELRAKEAEIQSDINASTTELQKQKKELEDITNSTGLFHKALEKIGDSVKSLISKDGAKKLWELLIGSNEEMEQYQTSFEIMLGDAEKAKALISDIQSFAAKTPLTMSDSVSIGSQLIDYGVEADEVIDKMTKLGDLAGGDADKMNSIASAYGQMLAEGKVMEDGLRQMTEAVIPLQNALAESIGVTGEEFSKMVSAGQIGIDDLDRAIEELTTGNGRFAGTMEKQSQTMQGMLSNLQENVSEFFRQMGEGAFGEVKGVLAELMAQLKEWEEDGTLQEWAEGFGVTLKALVEILKGAIGFIFEFKDVIIAAFAGKATYSAVNSLMKWVKGLKQGFLDMVNGVKNSAVAMNGWALGIAAVTAVITALVIKISEANRVWEEYNNAIENIDKSSKNTIASSQAEMAVLKNKVERYDELRTAAELTAEQHAELKSIAEELQGTFGDEIEVVNKTTGAYNDLSEALETYTERKLLQAKNKAVYDRLEEYYKLRSEYEQNQDEIVQRREWSPDYRKFIEENASYIIWRGYKDEVEYLKWDYLIEDLDKKIEGILPTCKELDEELYKLGKTASDTAEENENLADSYEKNKRGANSNKGAVDELTGSCEQNTKAAETNKKAVEAHKEAADKLTKSIKNVNSAYLEQKENGKLSYDTIMSLVDAGYASCLEIDEETKAVKLNTDAYRDLARAKLEARMNDLKLDIEKRTAEVETKYNKYDKTIVTQAAHNPSLVKMVEEKKEEAIAAIVEAKAELAALQDLYDNIDDYVKAEQTSTSNSSVSTEKEIDEIKEAVDNLTKSLKSVNSAYLEQQENGKLSYDTAMSLIDAGYASCLVTDEETNAVRLNTEAYKELARAKLNARMNDLKAGDITSEVTAELAVLQDLYDNIDSYIKEDNSKTKSETIDYSEGYEAYKAEADKKLALISEELAAKKELRDKTIAYLDEEIKKRKELNQDDDMQKEIDRVAAQLEYAQLDDFSRAQLEKKLKSLKEEQGEILWQRDIQRQKDEADQAYESAAAAASKVQEQINNSVAVVKQIIDALKDGVTNINNVINNNNTVNNSANISLANQYLTMAQITKAVRDALIGDVTILTR